MQQALDENKPFLAIVGTPGELSREAPDTPHERRGISACLATLVRQFDYHSSDNGHDYFTIPFDAEGPEVRIRQSFGGVSGGAVWRLVNLFEQGSMSSELRSSDYVLAGIAFWQDPYHTPPEFIRTHGPRSLYQQFLPKLRDWLAGIG
jgi:hypothetical protein